MARARKPRESDPWPQRLRFMELVDSMVEAGTPLEQIADALGLPTTKSLEVSYRSDFSRIPGRKTMEKAAALFKVNLWEIYGPPEIEPKDELEQAREFIIDAMGSDITTRLTDDQILKAFRVARRAAQAVLDDRQ